MLWLTLHMWGVLLGAFALGVFIGWWVWHKSVDQGQSHSSKIDPRRDAPVLGTLEADIPRDSNTDQ